MTCMQAIVPEWIALIDWYRSTARPHTRGPMHEEEGDTLTSLAVRPSVSSTARTYVAVHMVVTRRSGLTRGTLTFVDF